MRITSKGQVTIPVEIREQLGLTPNTEVEFEVIGDAVYVKKTKAKPTSGKTLIEKMRGKATVKMTTDEIMALTRQDLILDIVTEDPNWFDWSAFLK